MQIGLIGINHKLADLHLRDSFAKACEKRFHHKHYSNPEHYLVMLSTCNRTEIYFTSSNLADTHSFILNILRQEVLQDDFDQKLYSYFGYECFYHLSRVTSGLDSACVAETEIQGQVKNAYESVLSTQSLPYIFHYLFQKSLAIGKQIRTTLQLGRGLPGLEEAVIENAVPVLGNLENVKILFVGGSSINEKIASNKKFKGCHLMTRSKERGDELQAQIGLISVPWNLQGWTEYDWIIFGTKSSNYLIGPSDEVFKQKKLIMDLSVPRNVDPRLSENPSITLLNIDQINQYLSIRQKELKNLLEQADLLAATLSERHHGIWHQKQADKLKTYAWT